MDTSSLLIDGENLLNFSPAKIGGKYVWTSSTAFTIGTAGKDTLFSDDTGVLIMKFNGTLTGDITNTGAGGLQTGSAEANDTWYGIYIIGDTTLANTPKLLLIPDGTAFSESGYDVKKLVSWVRNDNSSDFIHTKQVGTGIDRTHFILKVIPERRPLNNGSATTPTLVICDKFMPPSSTVGLFAIDFETGSAGAANDYVDINDPDSNQNTLIRCKPGFVSGDKSTFNIQCPLNANQEIEYDVQQGGTDENRTTIIVTGYVINL